VSSRVRIQAEKLQGSHTPDARNAIREQENYVQNTPAKRGRKPIEINWNLLDKLLALQISPEEITGFIPCSRDTLERAVHQRYGKALVKVMKLKRNVVIKETMWKSALAGNVRAQIFLFKKYLPWG
jgi:hypothetical protein